MQDLTVLVTQLAERLQRKQWMLATAESCTGGWIAKACTDLAGSSVWFECGFITYSNAAKQYLLGVNEQTLDTYGAVSEPVVQEMALGALRNSQAQIAVSVSGIAGPGGGTVSKPVGTVCFGYATVQGLCFSQICYFQGERESVRFQSVMHAIRSLSELL